MPEKTNEISELLRNADKFIKANKLDEALKMINKVFTLDQRNVYAKAYKERITYLMTSQGIQPKQEDVEPAAQKPAIESAPKEEVRVESAPQKNVVPAQEMKQEKPVTTPMKTDEPQKQTVPAVSFAKSTVPLKRSAATVEAYRTLLMDIWKDGKIDVQEQSRVDSMRDTFAISKEEHAKIEKEIRIASYLSAIKSEWQKGITNFEPLRKRYVISDSEQIGIEPKVLQLVQSLQANGSVLVLDDDVPFLNIVKELLTDAGYYCFTSTTGEEGLQLLETMTPDLVLCDVNFSKPNMSGFTFYEKFRSLEKFITTPFIFLSGLDQDVLIRTGKKLGADDYLTKPVDTELLIATIEGKLRRSRELRRSINN